MPNEERKSQTPRDLVQDRLSKAGVGEDAAPAEPVATPPPPAAGPVVSESAANGAPAINMDAMARAALGEQAVDLPAADGESPAPPAPADDPEMPQEARNDPRKRDAWAEQKRARKAAEKLAESLKPQLAEKDATIKELQQKLIELQEKHEREIAKVDVTKSKAFQERYVKPIQGTVGRMIQLLVEDGGMDAEAAKGMAQDLARAKNLGEVRQLLAELPDLVQATAGQLHIELREQFRRRDMALSDEQVRTTKQALAADDEKASSEERLHRAMELRDRALEKLSVRPEDGGTGSFLFAEMPNVPGWEDQRQRMISSATAIIRDNDPEVMAAAAFEYAAAPTYRATIAAQAQELQRLRRALAARDAVNPGYRGSIPPAGAPLAPPAKPSRESMDEALKDVGKV